MAHQLAASMAANLSHLRRTRVASQLASSSSSLSSRRYSSLLTGGRVRTTIPHSPALLSSPSLTAPPGIAAGHRSDQCATTVVVAGGSSVQQVRYRRRDGNKAFDKPRPPTKKQRKKYHRTLRAARERIEKHSPPGSKAGPRREWAKIVRDDLLGRLPDTMDDDDEQQEALEYGVDDAVLDDLMGNTSHLSAQPTPRPVYLGHKHPEYHQRVLRHLRESHADPADDSAPQHTPAPTSPPPDRLLSLALRSYRDANGTKSRPLGLAKALQYLLQDLGLPLASWGENTWTSLLTCCRTPAEGRKVLDLQRRQSNCPVTSYSWSILVDLHARLGDFEGCERVLREMQAEGGVSPTLPAYTSLISACARVCRNKRIAHPVRAHAARVGWDHWQEMRVGGLDPDAMAYGAMLSLMAATGQPERALNLLEEMTDHFHVKPTTYCFSCALRAVARSHATAIRHERGSSPRNKRREFLTRHHGMLARDIVTRAEAAEVKLDDGFVSALILCAAAAGDAATAKAVYVASQIRGLDHWRTIGPDSHLARLRGIQDPNVLLYPEERLADGSDRGSSSLVNGVERTDPSSLTSPLSFEEREYGRDSRVLSAILHACAQAVDRNMIGTMWQGRENGGYLCDNSLRLIMARRLPRYEDTTIPGQERTAELTWAGEHREDDYRGGNKRKSRKFEGLETIKNSSVSIDELDDMYRRIYVDDDGRLKPEFRKSTPDDIWRMKYGHDPEAMALLAISNNRAAQIEEPVEAAVQIEASSFSEAHEEELFFDNETMRWATRAPAPHLSIDNATSDSDDAGADADDVLEDLVFNTDTMRWESQQIRRERGITPSGVEIRALGGSVATGQEASPKNVDNEDEEELFFDEGTMRWNTRTKTRPKPVVHSRKDGRTDFESRVLDTSNKATRRQELSNTMTPQPVESMLKGIDEEELDLFRHELRAELAQSGEDVNSVTEEEVKELFLMMKGEYNDVMSMSPEDLAAALGVDDLSEIDASAFESYEDDDEDDDDEEGDDDTSTMETTLDTNARTSNFQQLVENMKDEWRTGGADLGDEEFLQPGSPQRELQTRNQLPTRKGRMQQLATIDDRDLAALGIHANESTEAHPMGVYISDSVEFFDDTSSSDLLQEKTDTDDMEMEALRRLLPTFSNRRLRRIRKVFRKSLGDPSLLDLVPLVRERMPDYIASTWLKQSSALTARYVVRKASEEGLVDIHMLNGVLELETLSGSLDRALEFYETEFDRQEIDRNEYSHRLILQMLVKNGRFSRALALKDSLIGIDSPPDILSYGSMVDYCGRRQQLGSAMILLKECVHVHGAPPGEASLTALRQLCRSNAKLTKDLESIVGPDPTEWLRHGEAHLKREMSKRGRRDVQLARNRLVHL